MNKYYVFYEDDYPDNDGVGMKSFTTLQPALDFIVERMKLSTKRTLNDYTLIEGKKLEVKAVDIVKSLRVV